MSERPAIRALTMDQSPCATGWAIGSPGDKRFLHGVFRLPSWHEREGQRGLAFQQWLYDLILANHVTHVFHEARVEIWDKSSDIDAWQKAQEGAIAAMTYAALGKEPLEIDVNDMRVRFIGTSKAPPTHSGKLSRPWLKNAAVQRCAMEGYDVSDDNEAEAIGHLYFALSHLDQRFASKTDLMFRRLDHQHTIKNFRGEALFALPAGGRK